ncbi:MAG: type II toxin-antitoxin system VapC family toxin [Rhodospirillaceae bacterium]|nr:type II toxin-antitoxin system VapC family toxin [Rhodospirillaceae bacterium]
MNGERVVLDSSVVLAMLFDEPGGEAVLALLPDCAMSTVNLAEVVTGLINHGGDPDRAVDTAARLPVDPVAVDREVALAAGRLRAVTLRYGLSLGDRICLCLAGKLELPVVTCDTMWRELDIGVDIRVLR